MRKHLFALFTTLCFGASFAQEDSTNANVEFQNTNEVPQYSEESSTQQIQQQVPTYYVQQPAQQATAPVYYQSVDANGQTVYYQVQGTQPVYQTAPAQPVYQAQPQNVYYAGGGTPQGTQNHNMTYLEQQLVMKKKKQDEKNAKVKDPNHSGLFLEADIGLAYASYTSIEEDDYRDEEEKREISGLGPITNFKIGMNIRGHVALYYNFYLHYLGNEVKETSRDNYGYSTYYNSEDTYDGTAVRLHDGLGVAVTPITNPENPFNNVSLAFTIGVDYTLGDIETRSYNMLFELEKVWKLTPRFGIGVGAYFAYDFYTDAFDNYDDDVDVDGNGHSFGLLIKFMRK